MQSGIDSSRLNTAQGATFPTSTQAAAAAGGQLFGESGPSFRDVLDAINPLEHIPIISNLFDKAMDHKPSVVSQLVGGALLGGPVGLVASLGSVIFQQQTGHDVAGAMFAALSGDEGDTSTQLAEADEAPAEAQIASTESSDNETLTVASLGSTSQQLMLDSAPVEQVTVTPAAASRPAPTSREQAVLDLYGASPASAHRSYQNVQMRSYLNDVTTSQVL